MAFAFHETNCVIVGTFNIYIIRPDWLGKIGLLPNKSEVKIEGLLNQPGFRLSSPALGATWAVFPERLVIETNDPNKDCGTIASRVIEVLPWTPLRALGCNFVFRGDESSIGIWDQINSFPPATAPNGHTLEQRTWHIGVKESDEVFNFQLSETKEGIEIRANVHVELHDKDNDFAVEKAKRFTQMRRQAVGLMTELFKARFEHAIND